MYQPNGLTRREREVTDINEIIRILDTAKAVHLGLCLDNEPYVVPMNYGYTMEQGELTLYLHGAKTGKKINIIKQNPRVHFELDCEIVPFEGDVACRYGVSYSSVMGRGTAQIIEDEGEKSKALSILMKTQTGKDFEFTERMASVVSVIKIKADEFTAKHRPLPKRSC